MPRGQPDFGLYAVKETVSSLADLGELAARLGSIVTYDRRGDVVWFDEFKGDLKMWTVVVSGAGGSAGISADSPFRGSFSCKMITGSDALQYVTIRHDGHGLVFSKIGLEFAFTIHDDLSHIRGTFLYYNGTNYYDTEITYDPGNKTLTYLNSSGQRITFATGIDLEEGTNLFHILKFVVDLPNEKYNRVLLDHLSYDLSAISIRAISSGTGINHQFAIQTLTTRDRNVISHVGSAILTQNEP